jgi:hypothetical protein
MGIACGSSARDNQATYQIGFVKMDTFSSEF